jgi:hypothetical protein
MVGPTWDDIIRLLQAVLVWPVAAVVLVTILRKDLTGLVKRLQSWEGFGQKASFREGLVQAEAAADRAKDDVPPDLYDMQVTGDLDIDVDALALIDSNPSSALMLSWRTFQKRIETAVSDLHLAKSRPHAFPQTLRLLGDAKVVDSDWMIAADSLRRLRNRVAHGQHIPNSGEALAFMQTVHSLNVRLKWGQEHQGNLTGAKGPG